MAKSTRTLLEVGMWKAMAEFLACPLSKQPLRYCERTGSLICDALSVSYPIVDGVPLLDPREGKILDVAPALADNPSSNDPEAI
ncbi:trm112p-like protein [Wolffia australiana]